MSYTIFIILYNIARLMTAKRSNRYYNVKRQKPNYSYRLW